MAKLLKNKMYKSNLQRIREDTYKIQKKPRKKPALLISSTEVIINENKTLTLDDHLRIIRQQIEDEKTIEGEQTTIKEGFVYLISNPNWNGWIKAGMTTDYESRISTYNIYDPTHSFSYIDIKWSSDRKYAENHLLNVLSIHSRERKGEWFRISVEKAKILMQTTV